MKRSFIITLALIAAIAVPLCASSGWARGLGVLVAGGAQTLDLSTQFIAGARYDQPIEAHVELLRETGRFLFMRGLVKQDETVIASFTATVRKPSRP